MRILFMHFKVNTRVLLASAYVSYAVYVDDIDLVLLRPSEERTLL